MSGSTHKQDAKALKSGESYAFLVSEFTFQSHYGIQCNSVALEMLNVFQYDNK